MSVLKVAAVNASLLVASFLALASIGCAGGDGRAAYTESDIEAGEGLATGQPLRCQSGEVQSCTIWLGQHGDLANCIHGLDVCSDGAWSGCVDEATLAENPELYAELTGEVVESETP